MEKSASVTQRKNTANKERVFILDFLRGFTVFSMILFHATYDLVFIFGVSMPWFLGWQGAVWQKSISWTFILVSGAALHYSRKPVKRGLLIFSFGMVVTAVTLLFMPDEKILFGVLHCLGLCMMISGGSLRLLKKIPNPIGMLGCISLFLFTWGIPQGFVGVYTAPLLYMPKWMYQSEWLFFLGLPSANFWSSDYFPLIPFLFLYISGFYLWGSIQIKFKKQCCKPNIVEWIGQNSLWVYMLHQPIVYGVLSLFFMFS